MQRDFVAGIFRNVQAVVRRVRGTRRNQMDVHRGAIRPGVALVDGMAMRIDEQRAVKVRPFFHWAFAVVFGFAAPEKRLAFLVGGLQLEPHVERIDRPAGEEVADLARAHNDVDTHIVAAAHLCIHTPQRSGDGSRFARRSPGQRSIRFFADSE